MHSTQDQLAALNNLIAGVNIAQKRGTYTLAEAAQLHSSITLLVEALQQPAAPAVSTPVEVDVFPSEETS